MRLSSNYLKQLALATMMTFSGACQESAAPLDAANDKVIWPDGKADNYYSNVAQEYLATAQVEITLDELTATDKSDEEKMSLAEELMKAKSRQISWFLHVYLIDKHGEGDEADYGGMRAMVMYNGEDSTNLRPVEGAPHKYVYDFSVQIGGTKRLLTKIREDNKLTGADTILPLQMPTLDNEHLRRLATSLYEPGKWSPLTCKCTLESLPLKLEPIEPSNDAYLDYPGLFADGTLDIGVHIGWDYHARYDLTHARDLYDWLTTQMGFISPASSFEKYHRKSGPLTKTIKVNEREIQIRLGLFHPDPCETWTEAGYSGSWSKAMGTDENYKKRACADFAWDEEEANANPTTARGAGNMMADLKESLTTREVIIFTGHSGYTYGFALASWFKTSAGDLDPPEMKTLPLPAKLSQIVMMSGCETYHTAQAFKENPNKVGLRNIDVITTNSFTSAGNVSDVKRLIQSLVGQDKSTTLKLQTYGRLLAQFNPSERDYSYLQFPMFGVHGIDDNPKVNPLGDFSLTCKTCNTDADCAAAGNVCVSLDAEQKICAVDCLSDDGCSSGLVCRSFGNTIYSYTESGKACVPQELSCKNYLATNNGPVSIKTRIFQGNLLPGDLEIHQVTVGPNAKKITIKMTGTGNADMYTRFDAPPTETEFDCRPHNKTSRETCKYKTAKGSVLHLGVKGLNKVNRYTVKVSWE